MSERRRTLFASVNLIGDTITQTPAIRRYKAAHPDEHVVWMLQDDASRSLFEGMAAAGVCDDVAFEANWDRLRAMDYPGFERRFLLEAIRAFEIGHREGIHIARAYGRIVGIDVPRTDILPTVPLRDEDLTHIGVPPRCLVVSPKSASNAAVHGFAGNKNLAWEAWPRLIDRFLSAGRVDNYVLLLGPQDPEPAVPLCVLRLSLAWTAAYIQKACAEGGAYCGVDNGITHVAAGLRVPTYCVYPAGMAPHWCGYPDFPHYRMARTQPFRSDLDEIWSAWKDRL
jgi:hypothetical protein